MLFLFFLLSRKNSFSNLLPLSILPEFPGKVFCCFPSLMKSSNKSHGQPQFPSGIFSKDRLLSLFCGYHQYLFFFSNLYFNQGCLDGSEGSFDLSCTLNEDGFLSSDSDCKELNCKTCSLRCFIKSRISSKLVCTWLNR